MYMVKPFGLVKSEVFGIVNARLQKYSDIQNNPSTKNPIRGRFIYIT
jgi:hypothetical protein